MTRAFLRGTVAAAAMAMSAACLQAAWAQEPAAPAARPAAAPQPSADSLLDKAGDANRPTAAAPAPTAVANPAPSAPPAPVAEAKPAAEPPSVAEAPVPEVNFDEPEATTAAVGSSPAEPRAQPDVETARDETRGRDAPTTGPLPSSEGKQARTEDAVGRDRPARAATGKRAATIKTRPASVALRKEREMIRREDREVRPRLRAAREPDAQSVVRRRFEAEPRPERFVRARMGPSGLELARRAARRHGVEAPEAYAEGPDFGERVVIVRPRSYGRVYIVEE